MSSASTKISAAEDVEPTCRVCLGPEETIGDPLIYACACRGTQKMLHRSCLVKAVAHRDGRVQNPHCELCKQPYFGDGALALADDALKRAESCADNEMRTAQLPFAWQQRGEALMGSGHYMEAKPLLRNAVEGFNIHLGRDHPQSLGALSSLAFLLDTLGEREEAHQLHRSAVSGCNKTLGTEHPDTLNATERLAMSLCNQKKYEEAESLCRQVLSACERVLGSGDQTTLSVKNNLCTILDHRGEYSLVEPILRENVQRTEEILGADHPETLSVVGNLAFALRRLGRRGEAEDLYRRVVEGKERSLGPDHPSTVSAQHQLAALLKKSGNDTEAETIYRRIIDGFQSAGFRSHASWLQDHPNAKTHGEDCMDALLAMAHLATILGNRGNADDEAADLCRRCLKGFTEILGANHPVSEACAARLDRLNRRLSATRLQGAVQTNHLPFS